MGAGRELTARRRDGSLVPVEISLSVVDHEDEQLAIAFVTDITGRRRIEAHYQRDREALGRAEKLAALGTLAAGLAHEINNPIGVIASRIELMLAEDEGGSLPPRVREDLQVVQRNVQRVARIAQGLLSFAHQSPRDRGPVAVNTVVQETMLLVGRQLARRGADVQVKLEPDLPPVVGDAGALQQVVLNLLTNAHEALGAGGAIAVQTQRAPEGPGWIELIVSDSGPGIPGELLGRVFDPFFTTKPHGTGLGLSVTYGIVRDHGGTIDVRSEPGQGATFVVRLPVAAPR
jgi:signal transduction histidine kinase